MTRSHERHRPKNNERRGGVADAIIGVIVMGVAVAALLASPNAGQGDSGVALTRPIALLLGLCGAAVAINALLFGGCGLPRGEARAVAFLLAAATLFAAAIEPLGLLVATPAAAITATYASVEARPREALVASMLLTAAAVAGNFVLDLALPVAPFI